MSSRVRVPYLVIGAGLQGSGIALELARHGKPVILVERDSRAMNRASLRNEGKIHLGFIYAADESGMTGRLQLTGALQFDRILRSWLGKAVDRIRVSTPFVYLVANESLLTPTALLSHYRRIEAHYRDLTSQDSRLSYLGSREESLFTPFPLDRAESPFREECFKEAFATGERAIDTDDLAREIRWALSASPAVELLCGHSVIDLAPSGDEWEVTLQTRRSERRTIRAGTVFNAAWDQRLRLDQLAGLQPPAGWLHRLKYRVIASLPEGMRGFPSATMVLGAFGDVVVREQTAYLSWYPAGLRGWSKELSPPVDWDHATAAACTDPNSLRIASSILDATASWYPALKASRLLTVDAGAIFAYGTTDVDQLDSELHHRSQIGIRRLGRFFSVDPGKLTTAPMFAVDAVEQALKDL